MAVVKATKAGEFVEDVCVQIEELSDTHAAAGDAILSLLSSEFPVRVM